jgi:hypothetical protein
LTAVGALPNTDARTAGWARWLARSAAPWTALKWRNAFLDALAEAFRKTRGVARVELCGMYGATGSMEATGHVVGVDCLIQRNFSCESRNVRYAHLSPPYFVRIVIESPSKSAMKTRYSSSKPCRTNRPPRKDGAQGCVTATHS